MNVSLLCFIISVVYADVLSVLRKFCWITCMLPMILNTFGYTWASFAINHLIYMMIVYAECSIAINFILFIQKVISCLCFMSSGRPTKNLHKKIHKMSCTCLIGLMKKKTENLYLNAPIKHIQLILWIYLVESFFCGPNTPLK